MNQILLILKILVAIVALPTGLYGLLAARKKFKSAKREELILKDNEASSFVSQFNESEIRSALRGYIVPYCSPSDPTNKEGEEHLADTRENIFYYMDRNIKYTNRSYHILMADTGMGKTSFCLNYYVHCRNTFPDLNICLASLSAGNVKSIINSIHNKSKTLIILDALDEHKDNVSKGRDFLDSILNMCADFKSTIITCRSQYFLSDEFIPRETPLPILIPRKLGQSQNFSLIRSYITPFDSSQISKYIDRHFPKWKIWQANLREKATKLANDVPDLAYRPMLLERLPELVTDKETSGEIYELYEVLVDGWIMREAAWINPDNLRKVSGELAVFIYERALEKAARISAEEVDFVAQSTIQQNPEWQHLKARSLLNRDSSGRFKFAHRSILEFLLVRLTIEGDDRPIGMPWSPFMKELLVSWGHKVGAGTSLSRASQILLNPLSQKNISPLFDMWASSGAYGFPDFQRSAARRYTHTGSRIAPATWRTHSISVTQQKFGWRIEDSEYNLDWNLVNNDFFIESGIQESFNDIWNIYQEDENKFFPSYDQFITFIEGISLSNKDDIINYGDKFLISDTPERGLYLICTIDKNFSPSKYMNIIDKSRNIANTNHCITTYVTGARISPKFGQNLKLRQLWLTSSR